MNRKQRLENLINVFRNNLPSPETELHFRSPYELVVAVILSAQCTDVRVNQITPEFFRSFPDTESLANASIEHIFEKIKSCSYPNNKAKNLKNMAITLLERFKGSLPENPEQMQELPGVGRKTAHVLASVLFEQNVLAVDTHVQRVSVRLGLAPGAKTPLAVERKLVEIAPPETLHNLHHWLILHGRYVCKARKPLCEKCPVIEFCTYKLKTI